MTGKHEVISHFHVVVVVFPQKMIYALDSSFKIPGYVFQRKYSWLSLIDFTTYFIHIDQTYKT